MSLEKIIKLTTVVDSHGESEIDLWAVPYHWEEDGFIHNLEQKSDAKRFVSQRFSSYRCGCDHDCCAHRFGYTGDIVGHDNAGEYWIVHQWWGINI